MTRLIGLTVALTLVAACNSGSDEVAPGTGPLCANVMEKLRGCGIYGDGALPCVDGIILGIGADIEGPVSLREPDGNAAYNARVKCVYDCIMRQSCESLLERGCSQNGFATSRIAFANPCTLTCSESTFPCSLPNYTLVHHGVCNQRSDCPNGEDEVGCSNNFVCGAGQVGRSIFAGRRCDGRDDCRLAERVSGPDGSVSWVEEPGDDEVGCPGDVFQCPDGSTVPDIWVCDGVIAHCEGAEDEAACPDNFYCDNGAFLPMTSVCDGAADCGNGEDETGCAAENEAACRR